MNRRGPGRKCCCHTEALHVGYQVILFTRSIAESHGLFTRVFFLSRIIEFANWFIFTRRITESHGLFTRVFLLSRICELSNWFFFTRRIAESHGVLSRDLSFGPTDQREVIIVFLSSHGESRRVSGFMSRIIELSNFFSHGESRRFSLSRDMFLVTNLRISFLHTECHGWLWRL